jgi:DNA topoisomerase III
VDDEDSKKKDDDESSQLMPEFVVGETGEHLPILEQKQTSAPKYYTEATLLRAMETAGKQIDDEDLRDLMKENGIGRPSTRANIIQTLFKRQYIAKQRKNIIPTRTGIQLIDTIKHDMLKSAELTGRWEKNLQDIEKGKYGVKQFLYEMNQFVREVVTQVKFDHQGITFQENEKKKSASPKPKEKNDNSCPKCKKGTILKGKSAYGCSEFKNNCDFRLPIQLANIEITEKIVNDLVSKNKSALIKDVMMGNEKQNGHFFLNKSCNIEFKAQESVEWKCPKCSKGDIVKGKNAYGCNQFAKGCTFKIPFAYAGKNLTEKQIESLLTKGRTPLIKGFEHKGESFEGRIIISKSNDLEFVKGK